MAAEEESSHSTALPGDAMMTALMNGANVDSKEALEYINEGDNAWTMWLHALSVIDESQNLLSAVRLLEWCVKSEALKDDASVHVTCLRLLHELNRYDEFHSQCAAMSCCIAVEVAEQLIKDQQKCLKLALELFLLQNLLNPDQLCCTQRLIEMWLSDISKDCDSLDGISDDINKMLAVASSANQLLLFLRSLVPKVGTKLLALCTNLSLKLLQKLRHLVTTCLTESDRKQLASDMVEVCDIVCQLYPHDKVLLQSCSQSVSHLSSISLEKSDASDYVNKLSAAKELNSYKSNCTSSRDSLLDAINTLRLPYFGLTSSPRECSRDIITVDSNNKESEDNEATPTDVDDTNSCNNRYSDESELIIDVNDSADEDQSSAHDDDDDDVLWKEGDIEVRLESSGEEEASANHSSDETSKNDAEDDHASDGIALKININKSECIRIDKNKLKTYSHVKGRRRSMENSLLMTPLKENDRHVFDCIVELEDECGIRNEARKLLSKHDEHVKTSLRCNSAGSGQEKIVEKDDMFLKKRSSSRGVKYIDDDETAARRRNGQKARSSGAKLGQIVKRNREARVAMSKHNGKLSIEPIDTKDEGIKINCRFEPLSVQDKGSTKKDIWMPYKDCTNNSKESKKLILKRHCSDDSVSKVNESDVSRKRICRRSSQESCNSSGRIANGRVKHIPTATAATAAACEERCEQYSSAAVKKPPVRGFRSQSDDSAIKNGASGNKMGGKDKVRKFDKLGKNDVKREDESPVVDLDESSSSSQTRPTNEEVFRQISRDAGNGQMCTYCKHELRTRTQILRHADGACLKTKKQSAPPRSSDNVLSSDETNTPSVVPVARAKQRRGSDVVAVVSASKVERPRRHMIEIQNSDPVTIEQKPIIVDKPEVSVVNGMQVKSCIIEISPLKKSKEEEEEEEEEEEDEEEEEKEGDDNNDDDNGDSNKDDVVAPVEGDKKEEVKAESHVGDVTEGAVGTVQQQKQQQQETSEASVQCVCDGCGEVVPDCSWLTAHVVVCPGRSNAVDDVNTEEPEAPSWPSGQPAPETPETAAPVPPEVIEKTPASQPSSDVDAAGLLQLLRSVENSLLYGSSAGIAGSKEEVMETNQVVVGTPPKVVVESEIVKEVKEDEEVGALGRIVTYNGTEMFEFSEYKCGGCPLTFSEKQAALRHSTFSVDHIGSALLRQPVYVCMQCDMRCRQKRLLWYHSTYICHKSIVDEIPSDETSSSPSEEFHRCTICAKVFIAVDYLRRHMHFSHPTAMELAAAAAAAVETPVAPTPGGPQIGLATQLLTDWTDYCTPTPVVDVKQTVSASGTHQQALLDLACSMVLDGMCPVSVASTDKDACTSMAMPTAATVQSNASSSTSNQQLPLRRTAKGIVYKNVFMQCIVSYVCSNCSRDLSAKSAKREHRTIAPTSCFDSGPGGRRLFTYVRHYTYLCPYCGDRASTQKACRAHQLNVCLPRMGVKTDELNHKQLLCPFCQRKYFNIITLKGHMTLVHQVTRAESAALIASVTGAIIGEELLGLLPEGSGIGGQHAIHGSSKRRLAKPNGEKRSKENEDDGFAEDVDSYVSGSGSQDSHFETVDPSVSLNVSKGVVNVVTNKVKKPRSRSVRKPDKVMTPEERTQANAALRRRLSSWRKSKRKFMAKPQKKPPPVPLHRT